MNSLTSDNRHIIKKVTAELTLPGPDQQQQRSEQLKKAVQQALHNIAPQLEEPFADTVYRLDHLLVEVQLEESEIPQLTKRLEKALLKKILDAPTSGFGDLGSSGQGGEGDHPSQKTTLEKHRHNLVAHFLETGRLPWWAEEGSAAAVQDQLSEMSAAEWQVLIKPLAQSNYKVIDRIADQFPKAVIEQLIVKSSRDESIARAIIGFLKEIRFFLETQDISYSYPQHVMKLLYRKTFAGLLAGTPYSELLHELMTVMVGMDDEEIEFEALMEQLQQSDHKDKDEWLRVFKELRTEGVQRPVQPDDNLTLSADNESPSTEANDFTVQNGGVVLLHPFIEGLFNRLGLLEDEIFTSHEACERAVCLLQYLATGHEEFIEHQLVTAKFLCGWPLHQAVNRYLPISDYEKEECAALLQSSINHWEALKNTSVEGLREGFLQRPGILRQEEFGWSLYVEEKTQDVLLKQLPWGLSVIKFKWMNEMLTIHWVK